MKQLFLILTVLSCSVVTAKPHHRPKHMPAHARICRECDGDGVVRNWKSVWFGKRKCKVCDGRGYFLLPSPKPPMPKKAHKGGPVHRKGPPQANRPAQGKRPEPPKKGKPYQRHEPPQGKRPR